MIPRYLPRLSNSLMKTNFRNYHSNHRYSSEIELTPFGKILGIYLSCIAVSATVGACIKLCEKNENLYDESNDYSLEFLKKPSANAFILTGVKGFCDGTYNIIVGGIKGGVVGITAPISIPIIIHRFIKEKLHQSKVTFNEKESVNKPQILQITDSNFETILNERNSELNDKVKILNDEIDLKIQALEKKLDETEIKLISKKKYKTFIVNDKILEFKEENRKLLEEKSLLMEELKLLKSKKSNFLQRIFE